MLSAARTFPLFHALLLPSAGPQRYAYPCSAKLLFCAVCCPSLHPSAVRVTVKVMAGVGSPFGPVGPWRPVPPRSLAVPSGQSRPAGRSGRWLRLRRWRRPLLSVRWVPVARWGLVPRSRPPGPVGPCGTVKLNTALWVSPLLLTLAWVPGAPVVVFPTSTLAAPPVGPAGPVGPGRSRCRPGDRWGLPALLVPGRPGWFRCSSRFRLPCPTHRCHRGPGRPRRRRPPPGDLSGPPAAPAGRRSSPSR